MKCRKGYCGICYGKSPNCACSCHKRFNSDKNYLVRQWLGEDTEEGIMVTGYCKDTQHKECKDNNLCECSCHLVGIDKAKELATLDAIINNQDLAAMEGEAIRFLELESMKRSNSANFYCHESWEYPRRIKK